MTAVLTSEELVTLARAWIAVASGHQAHVTLEQINCLFWDQVGAKCAANGVTRSIPELQTQWKAMRPSMVAFITLFSQKCKGSRDNEVGLKEAFQSAVKTFRSATKTPFEYEAVAWLLVNHEMWWKVLKPQLLQQFALMHEEEELLVEELELEEISMSPVAGVARSRCEDEEELERRVRQRLDSDDLTSLTSVDELQQHSSQASTLKSAASQEVDEVKTAELAQVMEWRLELDIMTQSEDGLTDEAKEYLRLQRLRILQRLREKTQQQLQQLQLRP
ncbi:unnamed protein product [Phytophthora lilii]|uniref:Unnamed protein product n=1 Tax=Phytophthora lilii TaxID=2077276 RepID=A0A9W6YKU2_9STRA|nr:unnamed protein product [Phytophthora lilii]